MILVYMVMEQNTVHVYKVVSSDHLQWSSNINNNLMGTFTPPLWVSRLGEPALFNLFNVSSWHMFEYLYIQSSNYIATCFGFMSLEIMGGGSSFFACMCAVAKKINLWVVYNSETRDTFPTRNST